jgi:hypothetical protein
MYHTSLYEIEPLKSSFEKIIFMVVGEKSDNRHKGRYKLFKELWTIELIKRISRQTKLHAQTLE